MSIFSQKFPPSAPITEHNLPDLSGKTMVVTGASGGIGFHLCDFLFQAGCSVYMAARSESKLADAAAKIRQNHPSSKGSIHLVCIDLADLTSVAAAAASVSKAETRIDVLFNNAGVSGHPLEPKSPQGFDVQVATNVLGPFLLTKLLASRLRSASGRVIWPASLLVEAAAPPGGLDVERDVRNTRPNPNDIYTVTKVCNWALAEEMTRRPQGQGIFSLAVNPGSLRSDIWRWQMWWLRWLVWPGLYNTHYGAYTYLWAALSDVKPEDNGRYVIPWGRWHPNSRKDILDSLRPASEGGRGVGSELWEWCEAATKSFAV